MIVVADNLRITLPLVQQSVEAFHPEPIRKIAAACRGAGAQAIDINSGPLSRQAEEKMTFLVETVQESVDLPLVLGDPGVVGRDGLSGDHRLVDLGGALLDQRDERALAPVHGQRPLVVGHQDDDVRFRRCATAARSARPSRR